MGIFGNPFGREKEFSEKIGRLIQDLEDEDWDVRWGAVWTLVKIGEAAVELLLQALKDENRDIRRIITEILGAIRDSRAVEPLIQTLKVCSEERNMGS